MLYRPPALQEQPEVVIFNWKVVEATSKNGLIARHLVGSTPFDPGRVSSDIRSFDNGVFITARGRRYQVDGPPGTSPDAEYVYEQWSENHNIVETRDVTNEYQ